MQSKSTVDWGLKQQQWALSHLQLRDRNPGHSATPSSRLEVGPSWLCQHQPPLLQGLLLCVCVPSLMRIPVFGKRPVTLS
jgi:hypothetical protein